MNKDNAAQFLPLVQALAEGKTIERLSRVDNNWRPMSHVSFSDPPYQYRVKPEPEEIWRTTASDGRIFYFKDEVSARAHSLVFSKAAPWNTVTIERFVHATYR